MTQYALQYDIPPALFQKAMTLPIKQVPLWKTLLMNIGAGVGAVAVMVVIILAMRLWFPERDPTSFIVGLAFGYVSLLLIWHLQHRKHVRFHTRHDAQTGQNDITLDANGIVTAKPSIRTEMTWDFVQGFRTIAGATLIDLGAVRLIVPDDALPDGETPENFLGQLQSWKDAG